MQVAEELTAKDVIRAHARDEVGSWPSRQLHACQCPSVLPHNLSTGPVRARPAFAILTIVCVTGHRCDLPACASSVQRRLAPTRRPEGVPAAYTV